MKPLQESLQTRGHVDSKGIQARLVASAYIGVTTTTPDLFRVPRARWSEWAVIVGPHWLIARLQAS